MRVCTLAELLGLDRDVEGAVEHGGQAGAGGVQQRLELLAGGIPGQAVGDMLGAATPGPHRQQHVGHPVPGNCTQVQGAHFPVLHGKGHMSLVAAGQTTSSWCSIRLEVGEYRMAPDGKVSLLAASWNSARQRSNAAPPYSRSWLLLGSMGTVRPGHWH